MLCKKNGDENADSVGMVLKVGGGDGAEKKGSSNCDGDAPAVRIWRSEPNPEKLEIALQI